MRTRASQILGTGISPLALTAATANVAAAMSSTPPDDPTQEIRLSDDEPASEPRRVGE